MQKLERVNVRTWIEVDIKALAQNCKIFRALIPKTTKLMAVVKSNAYGHGLFDYSKAVAGCGVDALAADSIIEALRLRKEGLTLPILVLGYVLPEMYEKAIENNISITLSSSESFVNLEKLPAGKKIKIHVKVDTGMHRQGFMKNEISEVIDFLKKNNSAIEVEGLYTHFASAKNPAFPKDTLAQIEIFKKWIEAFKTAGFKPIVHASATSATILFPQAHFDMVRVGIGLYGMWPSNETKAFAERKFTLKPILTWKTIIGEIKKIPAGARVSYDLTEAVQKDSTIAICPIGYWHGYPRNLSSIGNVLVKGKRAKILGRISMDMIIIDITGISGVKAGDEVVLIGSQGKENISAEEVARLSDTSWYEIITRINPLIKKIYL